MIGILGGENFDGEIQYTSVSDVEKDKQNMRMTVA